MLEKVIIILLGLFVIGSISFLTSTEESKKNRNIYELILYILLFFLSGYLGYKSFDNRESTDVNKIVNVFLGPIYVVLLYCLHKLISQKENKTNNYLQYIIVFTISSATLLIVIILTLFTLLKRI